MDDKDFEILRIISVKHDGGEVKGFAEIRVGDVVIKSIRILQVNNKAFCALPRESFFSQRLGKQLHRSLIHLPEALRIRLYDEILKRWGELEKLKFNGEG